MLGYGEQAEANGLTKPDALRQRFLKVRGLHNAENTVVTNEAQPAIRTNISYGLPGIEAETHFDLSDFTGVQGTEQRVAAAPAQSRITKRPLRTERLAGWPEKSEMCSVVGLAVFLPGKQSLEKVLAGKSEMASNIRKDSSDCACFQAGVFRNGHVMFAEL